MKVMRKATVSAVVKGIDAGKNEGFYDSSHDEESDYNDFEINELSVKDEYKIIRVDFQLLMLKLIYYDDIKPIDYISRINTDDEIDLSQPCFLINSEGDIKPLHPEYMDSVKVHKSDDIVYDFVYDFMCGKINISVSFKSLMSILNFNK